jgi:hypothetical protein
MKPVREMAAALRTCGKDEAAKNCPRPRSLDGQEIETLRSITEMLRKPLDGEERVIGHIQKIDCTRRPIGYTVKSGDKVFALTSKDFQGLTVNTFVAAANGISVGCEENIGDYNAIVTFMPAAGQKGALRGDLQSIEFVPENFHYITDKEEPLGREVPLAAPDEAQRRAMAEAIRNELKKPVPERNARWAISRRSNVRQMVCSTTSRRGSAFFGF